MSSAIKIIAIAVVVFGGGYIGMLFSSRYAGRVAQLEQLQDAIVQIGFNISFLKMPLCSAISGVAASKRGAVGEIFNDMSMGIENGRISPSVAMERAILKNRANLCISKGDMDILMVFAENLGKGDVENETNNINAACARLKLATEEAEGEMQRQGKLCKGMGFLGGMLVAVLLF